MVQVFNNNKFNYQLATVSVKIHLLFDLEKVSMIFMCKRLRQKPQQSFNIIIYLASILLFKKLSANAKIYPQYYIEAYLCVIYCTIIKIS